jgi:hypothetical protein
MAHPDLAVLNSGQETVRRFHLQTSSSVFPAASLLHFAAESMSDDLVSVTDAEHGHRCSKYGGIHVRTARIIHARRSTRNDDAFPGRQLASSRVTGLNVGINAQFPNAPCN